MRIKVILALALTVGLAFGAVVQRHERDAENNEVARAEITQVLGDGHLDTDHRTKRGTNLPEVLVRHKRWGFLKKIGKKMKKHAKKVGHGMKHAAKKAVSFVKSKHSRVKSYFRRSGTIGHEIKSKFHSVVSGTKSLVRKAGSKGRSVGRNVLSLGGKVLSNVKSAAIGIHSVGKKIRSKARDVVKAGSLRSGMKKAIHGVGSIARKVVSTKVGEIKGAMSILHKGLSKAHSVVKNVGSVGVKGVSKVASLFKHSHKHSKKHSRKHSKKHSHMHSKKGSRSHKHSKKGSKSHKHSKKGSKSHKHSKKGSKSHKHSKKGSKSHKHSRGETGISVGGSTQGPLMSAVTFAGTGTTSVKVEDVDIRSLGGDIKSKLLSPVLKRSPKKSKRKSKKSKKSTKSKKSPKKSKKSPKKSKATSVSIGGVGDVVDKVKSLLDISPESPLTNRDLLPVVNPEEQSPTDVAELPVITDFCRCKASGDPHFKTYDGQMINFMGECMYTMSKSTDDMDPCSFNVEVKNEVRDGKTMVSWARLVDFSIYGLTIRISLRRKVYVNGFRKYPPFMGAGGKLSVTVNGQFVQVTTLCGVEVAFDGVHLIKVKVPKRFQSRMTGLCGDCDGQPNDFRLKNGSDVSTLDTKFSRIGASFVVFDNSDKPDNSENCQVIEPDIECSGTNINVLDKPDKCGMIKDKSGPFASCLDAIRQEVDAYYEACSFDACLHIDEPEEMQGAICKSLEALASECDEIGIPIRWRDVAKLCPIECGANSFYNPNMTGCQMQCGATLPPELCDLDIREGCQCAEGYILSGEECVSLDECGCFDNGDYFPLGTKLSTSDCSTVKECNRVDGVAEFVIKVVGQKCAQNAMCGLFEGEQKCACFDGFTGDGVTACVSMTFPEKPPELIPPVIDPPEIDVDEEIVPENIIEFVPEEEPEVGDVSDVEIETGEDNNGPIRQVVEKDLEPVIEVATPPPGVPTQIVEVTEIVPVVTEETIEVSEPPLIVERPVVEEVPVDVGGEIEEVPVVKQEVDTIPQEPITEKIPVVVEKEVVVTIPIPIVTEAPTEAPTEATTEPPTEAPTEPPTEVPTEPPTEAPTEPPTEAPTEPPTEAPTEPPTEAPAEPPTEAPTEPPTEATTEPPKEAPTEPPTEAPTEPPTEAPTEPPTEAPTEPPTEAPTEPPTEAPTEPPTEAPTEPPTEAPTEPPTEAPTEPPTEAPTEPPTEAPTEPPTEVPTEPPTEAPTELPTEAPTEPPTEAPTEPPNEPPTEAPTEPPTEAPTEQPTEAPTEPPTEPPTQAPTEPPTEAPTEPPTEPPTQAPTEAPPVETEAPSKVTQAPTPTACACQAKGDPHYTTFDGAHLSLTEDCKYLMAQLDGSPGCNVRVEVKNEKRAKSKFPNRSFTRLLDIKLAGDTIRLGNGKRISVNGNQVPVGFSGPDFNISREGFYNVVTTSCNVVIKFDGAYIARVIFPGVFRNKLSGLCGNCDGDQTDDLSVNGRSVLSYQNKQQGFLDLIGQFRVTDDSDTPSKNPSCNV